MSLGGGLISSDSEKQFIANKKAEQKAKEEQAHQQAVEGGIGLPEKQPVEEQEKGVVDVAKEGYEKYKEIKAEKEKKEQEEIERLKKEKEEAKLNKSSDTGAKTAEGTTAEGALGAETKVAGGAATKGAEAQAAKTTASAGAKAAGGAAATGAKAAGGVVAKALPVINIASWAAFAKDVLAALEPYIRYIVIMVLILEFAFGFIVGFVIYKALGGQLQGRSLLENIDLTKLDDSCLVEDVNYSAMEKDKTNQANQIIKSSEKDFSATMQDITNHINEDKTLSDSKKQEALKNIENIKKIYNELNNLNKNLAEYNKNFPTETDRNEQTRQKIRDLENNINNKYTDLQNLVKTTYQTIYQVDNSLGTPNQSGRIKIPDNIARFFGSEQDQKQNTFTHSWGAPQMIYFLKNLNESWPGKIRVGYISEEFGKSPNTSSRFNDGKDVMIWAPNTLEYNSWDNSVYNISTAEEFVKKMKELGATQIIGANKSLADKNLITYDESYKQYWLVRVDH